jgi:2-dehydropantoate 2-reductase
MKILIFGAGGVGSVLGGFLARTGHAVSLLGRRWHLDVIKKDGLTISGIWGNYRIKAFDLYTEVSQIKEPGFDLILLTVKAYDTSKALGQLLPLMKERTILLSFQNGLGNVETLLEKVSPEKFLAGRVIFGVETLPGQVKVTVNADDVVLGAMPGVTPVLSPERMAAVFQNSKIPTKAVPNILTFLWAKVIYNCALNPLCTVHEIPYGKILENEERKRSMELIVRECYAVALKKEVELEPQTAQEYLELLSGSLIPKTALHFPSMLQDLKKGKPIDIDALNGAICRMGKELGVPTPENQKAVEAVLDKMSSEAKIKN